MATVQSLACIAFSPEALDVHDYTYQAKCTCFSGIILSAGKDTIMLAAMISIANEGLKKSFYFRFHILIILNL